ncbi:MAG: C-terminal binding protein [Anaerolineae bacterium]|jgi:D-3-phosphoglycerate dehydrogenase
MRTIVHTGATPDAPLAIERSVLDVPDVQLILRGRCQTPAEVLAAVQDADVALCFGEPYTEAVFAGAPRLLAVVRYGIGVDTIDLEAATRHGVMAVNFPDFCIREVANHALALLLTCARRITQHDRAIRNEGWAATRRYRSQVGTIHDETLGLIAFGHIAQALAVRAKSMEMRLLAYDPFVDDKVFEQYGVERANSLTELAAASDYVSCHLPLSPQTRGMVDRSFFEAMKPTAFFINTSRGAVVVERDLVAALQAGELAGAGLDVFETEPIAPDHPLCAMDNVVLTPHCASFADRTFDALYRRVGTAALTIARGGVPEFVANREVLPHRRR